MNNKMENVNFTSFFSDFLINLRTCGAVEFLFLASERGMHRSLSLQGQGLMNS